MPQSIAYRIGLQLGGVWLIVCSLSAAVAEEPLVANSSSGLPRTIDVSVSQERGYAVESESAPSPAPLLSSQTHSDITVQSADDAAVDAGEQRIIKRSSGTGENASSPASTSDERTTMPSGGRMVLALVAVLGLIGLAALVARRLLVIKNRRSGNVKLVDIVARTSIGPRQSLCVVRLADRLLLVGLSPNHMAALDVIDDAETVARLMGDVARQSSESISAGFSNLFQREARQFDLTENEPVTGETSGEEGNASLPADSGWCRARGELSDLLNKVKGLSRLHWH